MDLFAYLARHPIRYFSDHMSGSLGNRVTTVANIDRVIVIDDGTVVQGGPPDSLRRSGGLYERLWRLQGAGL